MTDQSTIARVEQFHGHMCPGLAMGIRAAEILLEQVGPHSSDEEVVAIVETDMCGVDAIQFLTGCTFGKGNLIHRDHGKNVYTFARRSDGRAVRVSTRPQAWGEPAPDWDALSAKLSTGHATPAERERFQTLHRARAEDILARPIEDLYDIRDVDIDMPRPARVFRSVTCEQCGEPTMETRIRLLRGRQLCPPCFGQPID